jgi:hypothetical protein
LRKPKLRYCGTPTRSRRERGSTNIKQRCRELNIPKRFAPRLSMPCWVKNDTDYLTQAEKKELRQAAYSRVDAMKKQAVTEISRRSIEAQEKILVPGLTSPIAQKLLAEIANYLIGSFGRFLGVLVGHWFLAPQRGSRIREGEAGS